MGTRTEAPIASIARTDDFREWITNLNVELPANTTGELPGGMGYFTMIEGSCTSLVVDSVDCVDLSHDLVLEFGLSIAGIGIECQVRGRTTTDADEDPYGNESGYLEVNVTLGGSSLDLKVAMENTTLPLTPDLPVPLGGINMSTCEADLQVLNMTWHGHGYVAETMDALGKDVVHLVGMAMNEPLCEGAQRFVGVNGTASLLVAAGMTERVLEPPPPVAQPEVLSPLLDWRSYPPLQVVQALVEERVPIMAGKVIQVIDVLNFDAVLADTDTMKVTLMQLGIDGIADDTDPSLGIMAQNSSLGIEAFLDGMEITAVLRLEVTLPGQVPFDQTVNITIGLEEVAIAVRAMVDDDKLKALQLDEAMTSLACLGRCTATTNPANASIAMEMFHTILRPNLVIRSSGSLATETSDLVNTVIAAVFRAYLPSVNALLNGLLGTLRGDLDHVLWEGFRKARPCSKDHADEVLSSKGVSAIYFMSLLVALVGLPISVAAHFLWGRSPVSETPEEASGDDQSVGTVGTPVAAAASAEPRKENDLETRPLCSQGFVSLGYAVYFPFAVFSVLLLFLASDVDVGATVVTVMAAGGKTATIGPLFSFSLASTVAHCWKSQAYLIGGLAIAASGIWPLFKLVILLVVWFMPPQQLRPTSRGRLLTILDTWGKYSFLDSWFLVLTLSAFSINWQSVGTASMKIQTTPALAFYAFFAATVFSLILGHMASECHHHAVAVARQAQKDADGRDDTQDLESASDVVAPLCKFAMSRMERVAIPAALVVTMLALLAGVFAPSLSFEVSGFFGEFLFGHKTEKVYSLLSVGAATADGRYNESGLVGLEVAFLLLVVVLPITLIASLIVLWTMPMRTVTQKALLHACYLMDAWSSLDVTVLVLVIAYFEFGRLAEFLVYKGNFATPCTMIKDITKEECLQITLNSQGGLYILFFLGVAFVIVPKVAMRVCGSCIETRLAPAWLSCEAPQKEGAKEDKIDCNKENVSASASSCRGVVDEDMQQTSV